MPVVQFKVGLFIGASRGASEMTWTLACLHRELSLYGATASYTYNSVSLGYFYLLDRTFTPNTSWPSLLPTPSSTVVWGTRLI
jgi:hypothetical protein